MIKILAAFISVFAMLTAHASEPQEQVKGGMKYSVLAIQYIGASDIPVPAVVISDSEAGAEWYRSAVLKRPKLFTNMHVIDDALLKRLVAEAESFERAVRPGIEKIPLSGGDISVTVITPGKKNTFLYYPETAVAQVDGLLKYCEGGSPLRSDLLKFQDRIRRLQ
jgi:hypothetical protein